MNYKLKSFLLLKDPVFHVIPFYVLVLLILALPFSDLLRGDFKDMAINSVIGALAIFCLYRVWLKASKYE